MKTIDNEDWDFDQVLQILCKKFSEEKPETLRSILNQEYQKRVKRTHKQFNSDSKRKEIFNAYNSAVKSKDYKEPGVILKIAKKTSIFSNTNRENSFGRILQQKLKRGRGYY